MSSTSKSTAISTTSSSSHSLATPPYTDPHTHGTLSSLDDLRETMSAFDDLGFNLPEPFSPNSHDQQSQLPSSLFHPSSPSSSSCAADLISCDFPSQGDHKDENNLATMELFSEQGFDFNLAATELSGPSSTASAVDSLQTNGGSMFDDFTFHESSLESTSTSTSVSASDLKTGPSDINTQPSISEFVDINSTTSGSPSPTRSSTPSSSIPPSPSTPSTPSYEDAIVPVVACFNCKRSHIKCDHGRPCQNCLKHPSKASTCRDAVPKPRGRPKGGSKTAVSDAAMIAARLQHQGYQPLSGNSFLPLHGQPEQPYRPRAMSFPHISPAQQGGYPATTMLPQHEHQQRELLLQHQEQYQRSQFPQLSGPSLEYRSHHPHQAGHSLSPPHWSHSAPPTPGVPEMSGPSMGVVETGHPTSAGPQLMSSDGYNNALGLDAYEYEQLQKHRQQHQQHQEMEKQRNGVAQEVPIPHDVAMAHSLSDHYSNSRASIRHFHTEHHELLQMQRRQHQYQRPRPHPGHSLTLMIPSITNGRLVPAGTTVSNPATPASSFPVSPGFPQSPTAMLQPPPLSPAQSIQSPTQPYHSLHPHHHPHHHPHQQQQHHHHPHHHVLHPLQAQKPSYTHTPMSPMSPMSHGPVMPNDATANVGISLAQLKEQELKIQQDLEMHEKQSLQKQQELVLNQIVSHHL
ncbi:hypothetical protein BCR41DRAFT_386373 [Lobosporangium transversale]|uniref:Zn(2)-C6 fungal-type domain-containing protein n=1 Tax=Lobosporangium transversale TaxID=64571 RepID=A0A1Y2GNU5_9FUNG|nr:hypothetical protein BCR41DRAFT_386373 [Lobosporangium transversale]ORZ16831.1 hypothetical protein BCR41DRAFT_386373 [Lobosporangium transversale]|eukprot:XP_021881766.1 hypothetical protein BCR41DRAFT_386373 [Lobosporangium transversale]